MTSLEPHLTPEENCSKDISPKEDFHHSLSFFAIVCKKMSHLNTKEINRLQRILKDTESGRNCQTRTYYFSDEDLFSTLCTNRVCREFCEKENLNTWDDIVAKYGIKLSTTDATK